MLEKNVIHKYVINKYIRIWVVDVSNGVIIFFYFSLTLTLKITLSHAICNSKNEYTFSSCYLYLFPPPPTFLQCHTIGHSPIFSCQLPIYTYPPETQLWSFCLCSGHSILVNFSDISHVTVVSLDVLYRAHSGFHRDTKCLEVSQWLHPLLGL